MYVSNLPIAIGHVSGSANKSNNTRKFMYVTTITVHTLCGYRFVVLVRMLFVSRISDWMWIVYMNKLNY